MTAPASRWVEREALAPGADGALLKRLRERLPSYTFEVVPALHVTAAGGKKGTRDVSLDLDANTSIEDLVGRIVETLEGP